eukprot:CAMPEP_0194268860 /NCGR_PEP_ID=MMETSP0169-20130528/3117_1 /TAXON_ID=218684 /ORGANISM="Corethron pennatum, Strain L29A3" /LENGTH=215 /DNA_ID=CAMNT_0039010269 /DNA_START=30 /DNA_END=674 /DNA_ORIENTATION=+
MQNNESKYTQRGNDKSDENIYEEISKGLDSSILADIAFSSTQDTSDFSVATDISDDEDDYENCNRNSSEIELDDAPIKKLHVQTNENCTLFENKPSGNNTDDPLTTQSMPNKKNRRVSFGSLHVREFPPILGDNPSCRSGPPIAMARDHTHEIEIDLETHELNKIAKRDYNHSCEAMYISVSMRKMLLIEEAHCSQNDLLKAEKDIKLIRKSRDW